MADTGKRTPSAIDAIAEDYIAGTARLNPEMHVYLGSNGPKDAYGDYSPAGAVAQRALRDEILARLGAEEAVDDVDRVTKADLARELELANEMHDMGLHLRDVNVIACPVQGIRAIFDLMPMATADDWLTIASRERNVPAAIDGYLATLGEGIARSIVPAKRQVREAAAQAAQYAKDGDFFDGLITRAREALGEAHTDEVERELVAGAEVAKAAYARLAAFLSDDLLPAASDEEAVGREIYSLCSRSFVGADIDLDETYEWGLGELQRMVDEQEAIANEILPGATVAEAVAHLEQDPEMQLHGKEALQRWMQGKADEAIRDLAGTHFIIDDRLRDIECMIAPTNEGGIYYTPPSEDFSRPGRMWWSVPEGVDRFDTWRELTTVYHEGVPGHHLQCAQAIANSDELNTWRRNNFISGHGEGWALYAERLMDELGYLKTPAERLGMLDGQRMRAARVVLDIGVHLKKPRPDGQGEWTPEYAFEFMKQHVNMNDGFIRFEVNRYLGWPGQAPSYKVGQRIWEQVRQEVEDAEGESFDVRQFHKRALDLGGVGLDTLRAALTGRLAS